MIGDDEIVDLSKRAGARDRRRRAIEKSAQNVAQAMRAPPPPSGEG